MEGFNWSHDRHVVTVFSAKMDGAACYRIPSIVRLEGSGALLAFAGPTSDDDLCGLRSGSAPPGVGAKDKV